MKNKTIKEILSSGELLFLDGGFGTQLQARGLGAGELPEDWNITHPDAVRSVHSAYRYAGSDVIYANTFGANRAKYHGAFPLADVIAAAVANARAATPGGHFVALDVGPTGRLLKPVGDFEFDAAYDAFAEAVTLGAKAGADLVVVETMADVYELKAAVLAAKENSSLPVFATVALDEKGKLLTGGDAECVAAVLDGLGVDAIGFNCGLGPDLMREHVERMARVTSRPLIVKPNAGLPQLEGGRTVFKVGPDEFAHDVAGLVEAGARIVGGCCGTTPDHIAAVHAALAERGAPPREAPLRRTLVASGTHAAEISPRDAVVVGERINPTGKKKLKQALVEGDMDYVLREAVAQAEAGADLLDVNVGVPGIDEPAVLDATVQAIQGVTDLPLQIDTSNPEALERALRHYNGKALVNSVNGKEESLSAVLPLVAKYGGVVVALTLDEKGIPASADGRLAIARRILERGREYGLVPEDFVVDPLCLSVATAQPGDAEKGEFPGCVALEALRRIRSELGCRTILGVSNISFGLPERALLNGAFFTLALEAGLSAAIVNPLSSEMMTALRAWRALTGRDASCGGWIEHANALGAVERPQVRTKTAVPAAAEDGVAGKALGACGQAVRRGLKADAGAAAAAALAGGMKPMELIDGEIVPALEEVGRGFEKGTLFLPQLLMAAEAASAAFDAVRAALKNDPAAPAQQSGRRVVMATVKGDIHDIGKNICRALLENYGFEVIDIGRDVPPEKVLAAAKESGARLVGLSALMTTTVCYMEETVKLLHAELPGCRVVVGGAVLTQEYADMIGADFYAKDAMEMVRICREVLG